MVSAGRRGLAGACRRPPARESRPVPGKATYNNFAGSRIDGMGTLWLVGIVLWGVGLLLVWALLYALGERETREHVGQ